MSTRSSSRNSNNVNKNITRNTTCCSLFDSDELEYCCDICKGKVDVLSHARRKKKQSNKDKHLSNKCSQPWTASYATNYSKALHHMKVCDYLNFETTIVIEDEFKHNKKSYSSLSSLTQSDSSSQSKTNEEKSTKTKTSKRVKLSSASDASKSTSSRSNAQCTLSELLILLRKSVSKKKTYNESLPSSTSNMSATLKDLMVLLHDLEKDSSKTTEINKKS